MAEPAELIVQLALKDQIDKYTVTEKLGEGTFGAVYKVKTADGKSFALKTEHASMKVTITYAECIAQQAPFQLLQLELKVMQELREQNSKACCLLEDKGRTDGFNYIVMKLVGPSLQDMKKCGADKHLSQGCALSVSMQTLEGLRELHSTGFLHRDIKPGNYAVGLEERGEARRIFLLDFGMCKPFRLKGVPYLLISY